MKSYTISSDVNVFAIALVSHIVLATPEAFILSWTSFSIPSWQQSMSCIASNCDHPQTSGRQSFASDEQIIFVQWQISTIFSRSVYVRPSGNHIHIFFSDRPSHFGSMNLSYLGFFEMSLKIYIKSTVVILLQQVYVIFQSSLRFLNTAFRWCSFNINHSTVKLIAQ